MSWRTTFVLAAIGASAAPARADDGKVTSGFAHALVDDMRRLVDAAIVARPPTLVPPTPIARKWKLAKLATVELGAPLLGLVAADLDGDKKAELYALTTREVVGFALGTDSKLRERGRVAFAGELASIQPRDIVGTVTADGQAVVASLSPWARSLRVTWKAPTLVGEPGPPGFLVCPGEVLQLVPGRNYFGDGSAGLYAVRCAPSLVDNDGYPLRARAAVSVTNKLDIAIERCAAPGLGCQPAARHEVTGVGTAFDIVDQDRDGKPELIHASAVPAGDPDTLKVITAGDDPKQARLKRAFAGGIAAVTAADLAGAGVREAVIATRVPGTSKIELWRIE